MDSNFLQEIRFLDSKASQIKVLEEAITLLNIGRINEKLCDYQDVLLN